MIAAPVYVYKKLIHPQNVTPWLCDLSRVSFFICGHTMKISLLVISFDRMLAIKYPCQYSKNVCKRNILIILILLWLLTLGVDMMPLSGTKPTWEDCLYVPTRAWGLSVIIAYNIVPFCITAVNYAVIWIVALRLAHTDKIREDSLLRRNVERPSKNSGRNNSKNSRKDRKSIKFAL
jgi:hypothetical protein